MDELIQILDEIGLPYAYSHFAQGSVPEGPYICYLVTSTSPFSADGKVYADFANIELELYTDKPEPDILNKIAAVLNEHGIFYGVTETWIPDQGLYQTWFSFELEVQ